MIIFCPYLRQRYPSSMPGMASEWERRWARRCREVLLEAASAASESNAKAEVCDRRAARVAECASNRDKWRQDGLEGAGSDEWTRGA